MDAHGQRSRRVQVAIDEGLPVFFITDAAKIPAQAGTSMTMGHIEVGVLKTQPYHAAPGGYGVFVPRTASDAGPPTGWTETILTSGATAPEEGEDLAEVWTLKTINGADGVAPYWERTLKKNGLPPPLVARCLREKNFAPTAGHGPESSAAGPPKLPLLGLAFWAVCHGGEARAGVMTEAGKKELAETLIPTYGTYNLLRDLEQPAVDLIDDGARPARGRGTRMVREAAASSGRIDSARMWLELNIGKPEEYHARMLLNQAINYDEIKARSERLNASKMAEASLGIWCLSTGKPVSPGRSYTDDLRYIRRCV